MLENKAFHLPLSLNNQRLPQHIAIIMDGNGRWAKDRQLPRLEGHEAGLKTAQQIIKACVKCEISALTLFAFSSENWQRPSKEVQGLLSLFLYALQQERETEALIQNNIQLRIIGNFSEFSLELQEEMIKLCQQTERNTGLILTIAVGYGGQWDILQATQAIARQVAAGQLKPEEITHESLEAHLQLSGLPFPDFCIRTGGEYRLSNFLLWHLAYSELYFTSTLWPDFDHQSLIEALLAYVNRNRRFGLTHE